MIKQKKQNLITNSFDENIVNRTKNKINFENRKKNLNENEKCMQTIFFINKKK